MKFCPECGSQLPLGPTKFCTNCGKNLWDIMESSSAFEQKGDMVESGTAIYALGVKLEQMVEQIMKNKGFSTERRIKMRGRSSTLHEIDVLAKRENDVLAVECKNYGEARVVGKKEVTDFHGKLEDLPEINHAMFVTNVKFTSELEKYAKQYHIELWDGEKLRCHFYLLNLGRLSSSSVVAEPAVTVLDTALPIKIQYDEATKLLLVNPHATSMETTLDLHPYYCFTYEVEIRKGLLGRQKTTEYGSCIVDATNKKILRRIEDNDAGYQKYKDSFFSKGESQNQEEMERLLDEMERTQIIEDLENIQWISEFKIEYCTEYAVNKLECKLPANAAERMVLEYVASEKKVKDDDVVIRKPSLVYVPKWLINIGSNETRYRRELLPTSETVIIDEIMFCPKDFYERRRTRKKTYAVCELCGRAYCRQHIYTSNDYFRCEKHMYRSTAMETKAQQQQQTKNIESSLSKINNSLEASVDKALEQQL